MTGELEAVENQPGLSQPNLSWYTHPAEASTSNSYRLIIYSPATVSFQDCSRLGHSETIAEQGAQHMQSGTWVGGGEINGNSPSKNKVGQMWSQSIALYSLFRRRYLSSSVKLNQFQRSGITSLMNQISARGKNLK